MKIKNNRNQTKRAFTLIEMIGVLAVIAILAALLIPKVFSAITEARINTVPVGCGTVKTAVIDHYAKYGALNTLRGTNSYEGADLPLYGYDMEVLLPEGFIDKPFAPRVGTTNSIVLSPAIDPEEPIEDGGDTFDLSGAENGNEANGTHVVAAWIDGVPVADAQAISMRIDGANLSEAENTTGDDTKGRVKYTVNSEKLASVWIYLTHR